MVPWRRNDKSGCFGLGRVHERDIRIVCFSVRLHDIEDCVFEETIVEARLIVSRGDFAHGNFVCIEDLLRKVNVCGNTIVYGLFPR